MHIHLDAVGGIAGDMFVAALLDAFPHHEGAVLAAVAAAVPVRCALLAHNDGVLQGRRFQVEPGTAAGAAPAHHHGEHGPDDHHHETGGAAHAHRHWRAIRHDLGHADLPAAARDCALGIFAQLAEAEARVHGIAVDDVAFHEVGAWDSIADIVAAGRLIAALDDAGGRATWSVGPLPLGSGRVRTAHGLLPVPAPATALLLEGLPTADDGIGGERVTPTGAAVLAFLRSSGRLAPGVAGTRTLRGSGIGFGTRRLPGIPNCLRALAFDATDEPAAAADAAHRELLVIEFEVDDQSAEDLAMGLDRLRAHPHVFDVVQMPVFGKKGRMMTSVRALARAGARAEAVAACFRETTTIGLRLHAVSGAALLREARTVEVDGRPVRVKTVERPGGRTAKAEADDALAGETHAARAALRRAAERLALESDGEP